MASWSDIGLWIDATSGGLFIILGGALFAVRPRQAVHVGLGLLCLLLGLHFLPSNLVNLGVLPDGPWKLPASTAAWLLPVPLLLLLLTFPTPAGPGRRRLLVLLVPGLVVFSLYLILEVYGHVPGTGQSPGAALVDGIHRLVPAVFLALLAGFAVRYHGLLATPRLRERRQLATASLALMLYAGLSSYPRIDLFVRTAQRFPDVPVSLRSVFAYLGDLHAYTLCVALACAWLWFGVKLAPAERRQARWIAWLALLMPLVGYALQAWGPVRLADSGLLGGSRIIAAAILAYAALMHGMFDIDVKLKWTLNQSSTGGAIVALFFLFQEGTEQILPVSGAGPSILAAALVSVAFVPVRRLATRLWEGALPDVQGENPAYVAARKEMAYATALEVALRDGKLTSRDSTFLAALATRLDLDTAEIRKIEASLNQGLPGPAAPR